MNRNHSSRTAAVAATALGAVTLVKAHPGHGEEAPAHPHGDSVWIGLLLALVLVVGLVMGTRR